MKIVFYNHTGKVSGAERLLLNALMRLDGAEFDRIMVCPADGPLAGLAAEAGMTVASRREPRGPLYLAARCFPPVRQILR